MEKTSILETGRNCWRICRAEKVAFLIDGAAYFKSLYDCLPRAEQQILILSWDIYSRLHLVPPEQRRDSNLPTALGDLLNQLAADKRDLHINVLSWDFSLLFAIAREWLPVYKLDWNTHRRLKFRLDDHCPPAASHHQKVVVLDNRLAFAGGLDLTLGRWDTPDHRSKDPRRQAVDGKSTPIRPYHDVQMAVSGAAAECLGDLARERWRRASAQSLETPPERQSEIWPENLRIDLEDVDVAIARTWSGDDNHEPICEVKQLYLDSIAAARTSIYLENQYFTAPDIADALSRRLQEEDGPEIILNLPREVDGWLAQQSMDMIRVELIRQLRQADKHNRFYVYYPDQASDSELPINLHAKVMVVDDRLLRIGSSNLNNRSMSLDTECDLVIEAPAEKQEVTEAIAHFRNRLLAEHLDVTPDRVAEAHRQQNSLGQAIEQLRDQGRSLSPLEKILPNPDPRILSELRLADPERPVNLEALLNHFVPEKELTSTGQRVTGWVLALLLLLGLAAAWRFTPLQNYLSIDYLTHLAETWQQSSWTPLVVIGAFIIGGLLVMPLTAMIIAAVLVFGPVSGFFYALTGAFLSALAGYGFGSLLGRNRVRHLAGSRLNQVSRYLGKRGLMTMIVVRIIPIAPFTIVNLIAGASHIKFRDFFIGTLLGMTPGMFGVTLLTDRVEATLLEPGWETILTLIVVAILVFTIGFFLSRKLFDLGQRQLKEESSPQTNQGSA